MQNVQPLEGGHEGGKNKRQHEEQPGDVGAAELGSVFCGVHYIVLETRGAARTAWCLLPGWRVGWLDRRHARSRALP